MSNREIPPELKQSLKKSGFSFEEPPPYVASLLQLPSFFRYFDRRYGKPDLENPKKKNGQYALRLILRYLAEHRGSTCEEIAQFEYDKDISTKRKLKSITDDIRKFVNQNLISSQLVLLDKPKKKYNKQVKTFSLSPIGILYCLYLFGNFRTPDESWGTFYVQDELESDILKNISKEYAFMLPKVFGRFQLFEKIFGGNFLSVVIDPLIAIYNTEIENIPASQFLLKNYVLSTFDFINGKRFRGPHQLILEQISLIFYINLEESIQHYLWSKEGDKDFKKTQDMTSEKANLFYKEKNKKSGDRYRQELKDTKILWNKIMNEDKELKKWYSEFLREVVAVKKNEQYVVSQYRKDVFVVPNFKNHT
ncbi:MAG: hypothetical protein OEL82_09690 [Nitrosopumilus sp.]|nr:hypothetical protein [Nitrosopumilus sp.]